MKKISSSSLLLLILGVSLILGCSDQEKTPSPPIQITYSAVDDFDMLEVEEFVPFYHDQERGVLAIDAAMYKDQFSIARLTFDGKSSIYDLTFQSMTEIDGESTYKVFINDSLVAEFQNPETEIDFEIIEHTARNIPIENGQIISVQFNSHSNGKIPENDAFAYARGRWKGLVLSKAE